MNHADEFEKWLETMQEEKTTLLGPGEGAVAPWRKEELFGFRRGIIDLKIKGFTETEVEVAKRKGPHKPHLLLAEWLFDRLAAYDDPDDGVTKEALEIAYQGNSDVFEDLDRNGIITKDEFLSYLSKIHTAKRAKQVGLGDQWLQMTLTTLESGCDVHDLATFRESPQEAATRTGPTEEHIAYARTIFQGMSKLSEPRDTMRKEDLVTVQGGDFRMLEKMDLNSDGVVTVGEWLAFITREHSIKRAKRKGSGDKAPL